MTYALWIVQGLVALLAAFVACGHWRLAWVVAPVGAPAVPLRASHTAGLGEYAEPRDSRKE